MKDRIIPYGILVDMPEGFKKIRKKLLRSVRSKLEGVNIKRVNEFSRSIALLPGVVRVFEDADLPKIRSILDPMNLLRGAFSQSENGMYIPEIDVSLVRRNSEMEETNGPFSTECVMIHERVHNSSACPYYTVLNNALPYEMYRSRSGLCLPQNEAVSSLGPWGYFFEEGTAELCASLYRKTYREETQRKKILRELQRPEEWTEESLIQFGEQDKSRYFLPVKYLLSGPDGPVVSVSSFAGFGLELLCIKDPSLWEALILGRRKLSSLRKIPKIVNGISPGLYGQLARYGYTDDEFIDGLRRIIVTVFGGKIAVNSSCEILF